MLTKTLPMSTATDGVNRLSRTLSSVREYSDDDGYDDKECDGVGLRPALAKKSADDFFGRSEELKALHKVKRRVMMTGGDDADTTSSSPLLLPAVLVWGVSGTGKSHFIQQFLNETQRQSACYVLQGKYDEYTGSSDPFSALVQALTDFSSQLENGEAEELRRIRECVKAAFGNDDNETDDDHDHESSPLSTLINIVPSLSILLDDHESGGSSAAFGAGLSSAAMESASLASSSSQHSFQPPISSSMGVNESVWNQLRYIFLQFVKAISTKERPVYLFLDDLQWSSPVALELLANLVSDAELKHFLFLGSIRQETNPHNDEVLEVATTSALSASFLTYLQSQPKELTHVTIQNLSLDDTVQFLSSLLGDHAIDDGLNTLAQKIHTKTQGNIFFTMQALEELQRKRMLIYDETSLQWEWKFDNVSGDDITISDNIVGAIESKLKELPQDLQDVLSVAAYVRATFDVDTLLHVLQNEERCQGASPFFTATAEVIDEQYLSTLLEKAVLEQLLSNSIGGTTYRFVHDRIQQAAHGMVPHGEVRNMLRLRIGHCLLGLYRGTNDRGHDILASPTTNSIALSNYAPDCQENGKPPTEDDDGLLFVAADHLNSVPTKDHMFSVMLNLEVGERAIQMAALASAADYLKLAANELKRVRNPWEEHYDVSLRLYRAQSDVELSLGHFEFGYKLCDEVLAKARTFDQKLPTYLSMARGLGREDKHFEALNVCLRAATKVGAFPKRWYLSHIGRDMMKIKAFMKRNDDATIMQMPFMTDQRQRMVTKLLTEISIRGLVTQQMIKWLANVCKHFLHTIQYGLCEDSATAFVYYGVVSGISGDLAMAMRCAGLAKRMISKTKGKSLAGLVSFLTATFIISFRSPITDVMQEHKRGYTLSMEAGEFEFGFVNRKMSILPALLSGYALPSLMQATEGILQQCKLYRVEALGNMAAGYLLMMRMLTGKEPIDWDEIEQSASREDRRENVDPSQLIALSSQYYRRMVLTTYFLRYDLGKKLADSYRCITSEEKVSLAVVSRALFPGINAAGRYRETGKGKHLRMLKNMMAELRNVAKTKGSKFIHHVLMLKAELASVQKKKQKSVKDAYDMAILVASNASFVQDAGLTCELAGEHCIRAGCSNAETSAYFVKAVGFYEDWGCVVKVDDLKQRRLEYLTGLNENRKADDAKVQQDGIISNMYGNNASSLRDSDDMMSTFTPSIPAMGSSIADSRTKIFFPLQEQSVGTEMDDCYMSVLTDGFEQV